MRRELVVWCLMALLGVTVARAQTTGGTETQGTQQDGGAEQGGGPPPRGQRHGPPSPAMELKRMTQELTLTEQQQGAILPILEKRQTEMQALRGSGEDRTAEMAKRKQIMETTRAEMRVLLTEEQQKKFDSMRGPGGPPPQGENSGSGTQPQ